MSEEPRLFGAPEATTAEHELVDEVMWDVHKGPMTVHVVVTWGDQVKATVCWAGMEVSRDELIAVIRALLNDEGIEDVFTDDPAS